MNPKLAVGLATFLAGVATSLSTAQHGWSDVATTGFIASAMLQLAGFIMGVWGGIETKPARDPEVRTRQSDQLTPGATTTTTTVVKADPIPPPVKP